MFTVEQKAQLVLSRWNELNAIEKEQLHKLKHRYNAEIALNYGLNCLQIFPVESKPIAEPLPCGEFEVIYSDRVLKYFTVSGLDIQVYHPREAIRVSRTTAIGTKPLAFVAIIEIDEKLFASCSWSKSHAVANLRQRAVVKRSGGGVIYVYPLQQVATRRV